MQLTPPTQLPRPEQGDPSTAPTPTMPLPTAPISPQSSNTSRTASPPHLAIFILRPGSAHTHRHPTTTASSTTHAPSPAHLSRPALLTSHPAPAPEPMPDYPRRPSGLGPALSLADSSRSHTAPHYHASTAAHCAPGQASSHITRCHTTPHHTTLRYTTPHHTTQYASSQTLTCKSIYTINAKLGSLLPHVLHFIGILLPHSGKQHETTLRPRTGKLSASTTVLTIARTGRT
jgi:hypothetical protein